MWLLKQRHHYTPLFLCVCVSSVMRKELDENFLFITCGFYNITQQIWRIRGVVAVPFVRIGGGWGELNGKKRLWFLFLFFVGAQSQANYQNIHPCWEIFLRFMHPSCSKAFLSKFELD